LVYFEFIPKGFMIVTAFLSLWISNTAATSMMMPIILSSCLGLIKHDSLYHDDAPETNDVGKSTETISTGLFIYFSVIAVDYF
jgi:hypothetical protein